MVKKFVFQLAVLLLVMHGTVLGMQVTKVLRIPIIKSFRQFHVTPIAHGLYMSQIIEQLNSTQSPLHKLAQSHIELRKAEIEVQIWSARWIPMDRKQELLEKLSKINAKE